jgi:hypothetical protein
MYIAKASRKGGRGREVERSRQRLLNVTFFNENKLYQIKLFGDRVRKKVAKTKQNKTKQRSKSCKFKRSKNAI